MFEASALDQSISKIVRVLAGKPVSASASTGSADGARGCGSALPVAGGVRPARAPSARVATSGVCPGDHRAPTTADELRGTECR